MSHEKLGFVQIKLHLEIENMFQKFNIDIRWKKHRVLETNARKMNLLCQMKCFVSKTYSVSLTLWHRSKLPLITEVLKGLLLSLCKHQRKDGIRAILLCFQSLGNSLLFQIKLIVFKYMYLLSVHHPNEFVATAILSDWTRPRKMIGASFDVHETKSRKDK